MPTLQTWTQPPTGGMAFMTAARAFVDTLPLPDPAKTILKAAVLNIGMELIVRELQAPPPGPGAAAPAAPALAPYVISIDQTAGNTSSDQGIALLQQWARGLHLSDNLPPEIGKEIQLWANPSNRYRILTQVGPAQPVARATVFT